MENKSKRKSYTKTLSLLIAIVIWAYVSIFVNPEITRRYNNIPIEIVNTEALENRLEIISNLDKLNIDIQVQGTRNSIAKTRKEEIVAYIDASSLRAGKDVTAKIHFTMPYKDLHITEQSKDTVVFTVKRITKTNQGAN